MKQTITLYKANGPIEPNALQSEIEAALPSSASLIDVSTVFLRAIPENDFLGSAEITINYEKTSELTQLQQEALQDAIDGHDGSVLLEKMDNMPAAIEWKRGQLANTDWTSTPLSVAERKLILGQALTDEEKDAILTEWENR